jgi:hypothetical protein
MGRLWPASQEGEPIMGKKEHCGNCGQELTEANITLACEDARLPQDELRFFCPRYSDEKGCPGYSEKDGKKMAYWSTN